MDDSFDLYPEEIKECKEALMNNDTAAAAAKIHKYLENEDNIPLNIAVTGECGSGKSTFVNAIRGIKNSDDGAAPTGCVETTIDVTPYPHPNFPKVTFWDLPGIGTTRFPADQYMEHVKFERFDFFIIISADRFRENDVKLAQEIQKMKKKFYFVRSKIDHNIQDEKRIKNFNEEMTLKRIRDDCIQGLQQQGIEAPQVFLVSSFELHLYDFSLLHETLERELPAHKRNALLFTMPNISREIINKKKKAFQANIKYHAVLSAIVAGVPVPGLSTTVDLGIMATVINKYVLGFGLDKLSLQRLADSTGVPYENLHAVIKSPLALEKINVDLLLKVISQITSSGVLMAAEEGSKFLPLFGIVAAMALSFTATYKTLSFFLNSLAEDAQRVLEKSLGLETSV
ncbi:interferon-inducible GTPase 5-like [Stegastes partitus]|uniref:Interferon-inducible GTPase 5-like n=1 Tax=Stegastes partitus TaxID=144197 RepID=A0A3B5B3X3_9TELE|nr:PREDICTED: interferon-inducible GTPase 5-like [Stegastes partitus]XP_008304205.1 PREDICTED: interferon-inducible GTPase 5-like [Stegastes partitus]